MKVSRLLASVEDYVYGLAEAEVAVHLFGGSEATLPVAGGRVTLRERSDHPWDGRVRVEVDPDGTRPFILSLQNPGWCRGAAARVDGEPRPAAHERSSLRIARSWAPGDVVELGLPAPAERLHPDVRQDAGQGVLRRGPLVYGAEERDHDVPPHRPRLPGEAPLSARHEPTLLGGIMVIEAPARAAEVEGWGSALYNTSPAPEGRTRLVAVPHYASANLRPNPMLVW
jgi:hypothetical protein